MCVHMYACVCACVCARSCVCTLICVHGKCIYRGPQAAEARLIHMGGNVRRRRQAQTGLSHQPRETELCMQCMGVYLKKKNSLIDIHKHIHTRSTHIKGSHGPHLRPGTAK